MAGGEFSKRRISAWRWAVQIVSFAVLMYGGYAVSGLQAWLGDSSYQTVERADSTGGIKSVRKRATVTEMPLPVTSCIYQRQGLCKSCSLYFVTDALTWQHPLEKVLPWLLVLTIFMLVAARLWCGWVCPLGFVSDLLTRARTIVGISQVRVSRRWREGLVWTKYTLLVLSLGVAAFASLPQMANHRLSLVDPFCQVCPSRIFAAFFTNDEVCWTIMHDPITQVFTVLGLLAFALFFIGLTVRRFWCRLCPIGGLSALFNRGGLAMLTKDASNCTRCGACARCCPLDVRKVYEGRGQEPVTSFECHLCLRCVEACPEKGCLSFQWLGKKIARSGK